MLPSGMTCRHIVVIPGTLDTTRAAAYPQSQSVDSTGGIRLTSCTIARVHYCTVEEQDAQPESLSRPAGDLVVCLAGAKRRSSVFPVNPI